MLISFHRLLFFCNFPAIDQNEYYEVLPRMVRVFLLHLKSPAPSSFSHLHYPLLYVFSYSFIYFLDSFSWLFVGFLTKNAYDHVSATTFSTLRKTGSRRSFFMPAETAITRFLSSGLLHFFAKTLFLFLLLSFILNVFLAKLGFLGVFPLSLQL